MRRVVVTGLGIVSSIGTGRDEVTASLRSAKSGVVAAPDHIQHGFRSQVWAPPSLGVTAEDWAPLVDRRAARFLANGTAWGHIAFEEALKDSGMTPEEIRDDRIGVIVGEILGSKAGIGTLINHAYGLLRTADYVALVLVTLVLVVGSDVLVSLLERRAQRWTE